MDSRSGIRKTMSAELHKVQWYKELSILRFYPALRCSSQAGRSVQAFTRRCKSIVFPSDRRNTIAIAVSEAISCMDLYQLSVHGILHPKKVTIQFT